MDKTELRAACETILRKLLDAPLRLARDRTHPAGCDAAYRLTGGTAVDARICVTIRRRFRPPEAAAIAATSTPDGCTQWMLFTEYVTPETAKQLRARDIWYADVQGNAYLTIPGYLRILISGHRPPRVATPKGQYFSAAGAKVLHYLLKRGPRVHATYRDVRGAVGVSIDKVGKLVRELEQAGTIRVRGRGNYEIGDGDRLLRLWAEAFAARLLPDLHIGRYATAIEFDLDLLIGEAAQVLNGHTIVGGEAAADLLAGHLRAGSLRLYVPADRANEVRRQLRLAPSARGSVELCALYSSDIAGEADAHGAAIAHPTFVYAELMAGEDARLAETALRLRQEHLAWI
jgi:hypothetical protein